MTDESIHIPIAEEELSVGVKRIVSAQVLVRTETNTVTEHATALLEHAEVEVTRVPIGEEVSVAPNMRVEGNVTIVPVMEEILVVEKKLVLKEEIHITRSVVTESVEIPITLRKQNAVVERDAHPKSSEKTEET